MTIPVGLNIWSRLVDKTFPYLDQVASPFDSIWMPDHVQYTSNDVAEGWTLAVWALARYPDKLVGHAVLCNSFRNPAHLAKMAATGQALSRGRVVMGIGAGWNEEEYTAYNWPFLTHRARIEQLAESIQLMRAMWSGHPASFQGKHYRINGAYCEPRPVPLPPVMVGGAGEKYLLRVVAEHADWWNYIYAERESYAQKQVILQEHCAAVGRDYAEIVQAINVGVLVAESERELQKLKERPDVRPPSPGTIVGTAEQVTEQLLAAVAQGAQRIIVNFLDAPRPEGTWLFAAAVMPHLQ